MERKRHRRLRRKFDARCAEKRVLCKVQGAGERARSETPQEDRISENKMKRLSDEKRHENRGEISEKLYERQVKEREGENKKGRKRRDRERRRQRNSVAE